MWGNINLLEFYSKNWQGSILSSMHPWLLHMSLWQYWLWFSFFISMAFYFIYIIKICTYSRADIRGTRSSGDKRRNAWSEILIVLFPIFWSINIVSNAFYYLRLLEGSNGYVFISIQISSYQWGWKYCYNDTSYLKILLNPIKVGYSSSFVTGGGLPFNYKLNLDVKLSNLMKFSISNILNTFSNKYKTNFEIENNKWEMSNWYGRDFHTEIYFNRWWLKHIGIIENEQLNAVKNQLYQTGFWVTSQGVNSTEAIIDPETDQLTIDPLRLLRSTNALVLPTRVFIRFMSCSEDITHSWAVPGLGIKMDCVPGRLFCLYNTIHREGIYFGQCSELCGLNHYNMPVVVYALPVEHFILWWEIELHIVFEDFTDIKNYSQEKINLSTNNYTNYYLFSIKYK